jgi:hypothetical protein
MTITPMDVYEQGGKQIEVLNICTLIDALFGTDWTTHPPYMEQGAKIMAWCKENNVSYYARPRDMFFMFEAVNLAIKEGHTKVLVEDMS